MNSFISTQNCYYLRQLHAQVVHERQPLHLAVWFGLWYGLVNH